MVLALTVEWFFSGGNSQVNAAMKATEFALEYAKENAEACGPLSLSVVGHSLGGTLAQITAYRFHAGMQRVDASLGRVPDEATDRASARLFAEAKTGGIIRADHGLMSTGAATNARGSNLFIVQGALNDPAHLRVQVPSAEAITTPVEQSFERAAAHGHAQARQEEQQHVRQQEPHGPRYSM
ncbi:XVIPCD domain-containing protein [Stenotrophomonas sp. YIM B06876]|uniref:XVIPCD domain-containing protein n=1 Tax=Stenotrophomonas sp. YIM B06876 TaxID=3060211 RepID=UPI002738D04E|nr:XVIPCD domain-containing protein [Stenotrophomonas sp. YIM B06876]